jgi:hypothetical protein
LKLNAIDFDTIADTSPRMDLKKEEWKTVVQDWKKYFCRRTLEYPTNEKRINVFERTLIANRSLESERQLTAAELEHIQAVMPPWWQALGDAKDHLEARDPSVSRTFNLVHKTLDGRRFCLTEKGYLGVVGGSTQRGDRLCIVQGASVPMILRPYDFSQEAREKGIDLGEKYAGVKFFVQAGVGYFHGIMNGEAMKNAGGGDVEMQKLLLV